MPNGLYFLQNYSNNIQMHKHLFVLKGFVNSTKFNCDFRLRLRACATLYLDNADEGHVLVQVLVFLI